MVKHNTTSTKIAALEHYRVNDESLYFQGKADLKYLINAWKNIDVKKFPMTKSVRSMVLKYWEAHPELHGVQDNVAIFHEHREFMQNLISIKYSIDMQNKPDGMFAILTPMTMETIWSTPAMSELQIDVESIKLEMTDVRNAAGMLILIYRLYSDKLDVSKLPIPRGDGLSDVLSYQATPDSQVRFFRVRVDNEIYTGNGWSVGMECDGDLPDLTNEDIERIMSNPFDPEHIRSIVDTSNFMFNGIMFLWAEEITHEHQVNLFRNQLDNRDSLRKKSHLAQFQNQVRDVMRLPDIEIGIILRPFDTANPLSRWKPHLNSLRFPTEEVIDPSELDANDFYILALDHRQIVNAITGERGTEILEQSGFKSLLVLPLLHHDECIGLVEYGSRKTHMFDFYSITKLLKISVHLATAIKQVQEGEYERMMAVIKQTCTAIHPSVEWRFHEMAQDYLKQVDNDEIPTPEPVVFKQVVPLFGVSDIRSSSTKRNVAIQADLLQQLSLASDVILTAGRSHPRPVFNELKYRIDQHQQSIADGLKSGDETRIYMFLRNVVESAFDELSLLTPEIQEKVRLYRAQIDPEVGVIYQVRKSYDESVTLLNDTIGAYLDSQQEIAQQMIPHYFEKFKTDGVDHNIYVGDSLLDSGFCSALDLRNLYLWQLMTMCGVVWIMRDLKPKLSTPLDTAHLILVQSAPLNITFQMEEKHFNVDGAYNARYEIIKKRIDKVCIHASGERLTQPEEIAIVYTQEHECQMYKEFISYLQNLGFLEATYIDELLEDLQGVHGLRALRVKVAQHPPDGWDPKSTYFTLSPDSQKS